MLSISLLFITVVIGGYFIFRYVSLICAIEKIIGDLEEIQHDLTQNQMLHLPIPNRHLKKLLCVFNSTLEEIQKERQKYEKREREFQRQIENISHDLRTPLTVILGYLKLFKNSQYNQLLENEELSETINIINYKAEMLKHLVTQFYDYSCVNADDYQLLLEEVDITRTLKESLAGNYQILEQACLKVDVEIPDYPVWGLGEASALERVFLNLFQNAGRYADTLFQIKMKEHENGIAISFTNDTQVLSEEDIPHLFERFYMQDASRSQGGTGLGLTVAKSLAERMNAVLDVKVVEQDLARHKFVICFELDMKKG